MLAETYNEIIQEFNTLEIVFVSSDNDKASFDQYYEDQPWDAVPFMSSGIAKTLNQVFSIRGIPTLIIIDPETGNIIDRDGRATVTNARGRIAVIVTKWNL